MRLFSTLIAILTFGSLLAPQVWAGRQLNTVEIRDLLAGKTVIGKMGLRQFRKTHFVDGTFIVEVKDFTLSGRWRVASNHYCQTMEGQAEVCYTIESDDGQYIMLKEDKLYSVFTVM